jgi:putative two-component system response regulator
MLCTYQSKKAVQKKLSNSSLNCLKEIHESSNSPFVIFDNKKRIIFANKAFYDKFNFDSDKYLTQQKLDFIFLKEDNKLVPFSSIPIKKILKESQIYSYFPKNKDEKYFYVSLFNIGKFEKIDIYYCILKEITELEEKLMEESIRALVIASQLKDNDTGNHVKRVNAYSYILAKHIYETRKDLYPEIDNEFINKIFKVASMHDVGKIGTPDYILTKPDKLTPDEFNIMKEHTINGAFILSKMAGQMARDIALFHHEKWDGSGYPYQLKEEEIPLAARIVSLVDVYDALRMKRHYKPSYTHKEAKQLIVKSKGAHFEPEIVESFLEIEQQFNEIYEKLSDETSASLSFHKDTIE